MTPSITYFLFFICLSLQAQRKQLGFLALLTLDAFNSKLEWLIINCRIPYFKCILDVYVQRVSNAHIWFRWAIYHFTKSDASDLKKLQSNCNNSHEVLSIISYIQQLCEVNTDNIFTLIFEIIKLEIRVVKTFFIEKWKHFS